MVSEALVSKKSVIPVNLEEPTNTPAASIEIPQQVKDAVIAFNSTFQEKREKISQREQLYGQSVVNLPSAESKKELMQRDLFFSTCLDNMERAASRLQKAFDEVTADTPVAYSSELCHASGLLLENALQVLIAYHAIPGEDGSHKIFDTIVSRMQRTVRQVHNLRR